MKEKILLALSFIALLASFLELPLPVDAGWLTILLCGVPIIWGAFHALINERNIKADLLVSLALLASLFISEIFAAAEIAFIMQLGAYLEEITVAKAQSDIRKLASLSPQTARRLFGGEEHLIPAEFVHVNDIIKVLPGETVPVDGVIIEGQTAIDQSVMTGESMPVDKSVGEEVYSGTINQFGPFTLRATKTGANSSMQRMVELVKNADAGKAKIVRLADKWATYIVLAALLTAVLTWFATGEIIRTVTILVVFCPCALVLATPTAIMAAIGNATKHGFLVRQGDALERLANVSEFVFDKTGTLTFGRLQVTKVHSFSADYSADELFQMSASVEAQSEHPLGKAILRSYSTKSNAALVPAANFTMFPGKGVQAILNNKRLLFGNTKLLAQANISLTQTQTAVIDDFLHKSSTIVYIADENSVLGFIVLTDTIRPQSAGMLQTLKNMQVRTTMLTGDNATTAANVAQSIGVCNVQAECLPEDKLTYIRTQQSKAQHLCMLGDGINDAPALKQAYVGIAMGGIGSDIAIDAADIVLTQDKVEELPHLLQLSKRMLQTIKLNLIFSLALNFLAIVLAVTGYLGPVVGALMHNGGSIIVILNSVLLLKWQNRKAATAHRSEHVKSYAF